MLHGKARNRVYAGVAIACGTAAAIIIAEVGLRALTSVSPAIDALVRGDHREFVHDAVLGHRPNPRSQDHDARGWRNNKRPGRVDVVAIGDSQTYGVSVDREQAWPQQLAQLSGLSVYNLAYGGYGAARYYLLLDEALELRPQLVVVGFYAGNDLYDAHKAVHLLQTATELASEDPAQVLGVHHAATTGDDILHGWHTAEAVLGGERAEYTGFSPTTLDSLTDLVRAETEDLEWPIPADVVKPPPPMPSLRLLGLLQQLFSNERVAVRTVRRLDPWPAHRAQADAVSDEILLAFDDGRMQTVLTPAARLAPLTLADIRIDDAWQMSMRAFETMAQRCQLVVLLIPTKESVFSSSLPPGTRLPSSYESLVVREKELWQRTKEHLDNAGVRWFDALSSLRRAIDSGDNPYYLDSDGHPNPIGYRYLAEDLSATEFVQSLVAKRGGAAP